MSPSTVIFKASNLPFQSVTVFNDRAQIKRELRTHLEAGMYDLVIENLANTIDGDSIRIDGTGAALIHEVKYKEEHAVDEDIDSAEIKNLVEERKALEKQRDELDDQKLIFQKQLESLNVMSTKLGSSDKNFVFDEATEESISKFLAFYDKTVRHIQQNLRQVSEPIEGLNQKTVKLTSQIEDLRKGAKLSRNVVVSVEVAKDGEIGLVLNYQVRHTRWYPLYDIRVTTAENIKDKTLMKLDYFAGITQKTGEEWTDAKIYLSTAQPCLGGNLPELGTLNATIPSREAFKRVTKSLMSLRSGGRSVNNRTSSGFSPMLENFDAEQQSPIEHILMTASKQILSTEFELPEKTTIPSDSSEHKMLITSVVFEPSLLHECVPKKSTNVFLTASVVNNSEFPLIEGDAAVYLNHSFVAKTHLKAVAPGEKFTCSLSVDNAVKVTYKAPQKFNTESGMFNKQATVANTQTITVQNNKTAEPITIIIREHIPKATDEKIKIKLLQPYIEMPNSGETPAKISSKVPIPGVIMNSDHNLEWTEKISQGEKKELVVKWQIEYPSHDHVEYHETY
ncbi:hypothetical protein QR680_007153 [Steinernema hermaphroditum]|uniref:DUF4139 domain-containing protein n=1 Tax=Steinernema hermaphroditum TaxID=289476 RepID=A0AA39HXS8_9BILA|nr:hypothetical protein QR680_007153 [Steinernema hermaphroditum]